MSLLPLPRKQGCGGPQSACLPRLTSLYLRQGVRLQAVAGAVWALVRV